MENVTFTRGKQLYVGKANTIYETDNPYYYEMECTNRISACNGEKRDVIEGKGLVNSTISSMLFQLFEKNGIPTHYVCRGSNALSKVVRKASMIKLEVIGRFVAAGSFCKRHPKIASGTVFDDMLFELTLKDDELGDPFISEDEAINKYHLVTQDQLEDIQDYTYNIGICARDFFKEFDLTLVDFKVEFGLDAQTGELILCDEFSPDTCRLWDKDGNSYDKDVFRKGLGNVSDTYQRLLDMIQK